jgi:hypothetical protein
MAKKNISASAYGAGRSDTTKPGIASTNKYGREFAHAANAPKTKYRGALDADARGARDFKRIGGCHGGAIDDPCAPMLGQGRTGTNVQHAAAKAKENIKPRNAHSFASFGNVGGKAKETNEE